MRIGQLDRGGSDGVLFTGRTIVASLATGVLVFLSICLLLSEFKPLDPTATMSLVMAGFTVVAVPIRMLVVNAVVQAQLQKIARGEHAQTARVSTADLPGTDHAKLLPVFLTKTILGAAIWEGLAFANLLAFLLEGQVYSLVLALALVAGMLLGFPTAQGLQDWLETHRRRLEECRLLAR